MVIIKLVREHECEQVVGGCQNHKHSKRESQNYTTYIKKCINVHTHACTYTYMYNWHSYIFLLNEQLFLSINIITAVTSCEIICWYRNTMICQEIQSVDLKQIPRDVKHSQESSMFCSVQVSPRKSSAKIWYIYSILSVYLKCEWHGLDLSFS